MNIDFIKWMCEKAEGFEWNESSKLTPIICPDTLQCPWGIKPFVCSTVYYPLLLQRAIEGVNKQSYFGNGQREIIQRRWGTQIKDYSTDDHDKKHFRFETYEDYKEQTLKYIYEQELNNA